MGTTCAICAVSLSPPQTLSLLLCLGIHTHMLQACSSHCRSLLAHLHTRENTSVLRDGGGRGDLVAVASGASSQPLAAPYLLLCKTRKHPLGGGLLHTTAIHLPSNQTRSPIILHHHHGSYSIVSLTST